MHYDYSNSFVLDIPIDRMKRNETKQNRSTGVMSFYCDLDQPMCASLLLLLLLFLLPSLVIGLTEEKKVLCNEATILFKIKKNSKWIEDWGKEYEQTQR